MEKVNWGIIGTGNIAKKFTEACKNVPSANLVAVASRNLDKAQKYANEFNIENAFGSYEELCKSNKIDAVYIATPHSEHFPCTMLAIEHKKHVLCEKPAAICKNQLLKMSNAAKENCVFLMEAMWTRFLPAITEAKKLIDSGIIGEVQGISADFCYNASELPSNHHLFNSKHGGGSLLDVGIYTINFADIFMDKYPSKIDSCAYIGDTKTDESTHISLTYDSGAMANLTSALFCHKPPTGNIFGSKAYITFSPFYAPKGFTVYENEKATEYSYPYEGNGFEGEITECCSCILNSKTESSIMPISKSLEMLDIMDKIREKIGLLYDDDKN